MVHLPTAVVGNHKSLVTLGNSGEIMAWFYPDKDAFQNVRACLPCFYFGAPHHGNLHFTFDEEWRKSQCYDGDSNVLVTQLFAPNFGLRARFTDCFCGELDPFSAAKNDDAVLLRRLEIENERAMRLVAGAFHLGEFRVGGQDKGGGVRYDSEARVLVQSHREAALCIGGDALESWQCGKSRAGWSSNACGDLMDGALNRQDLEIGEVNCAFGFDFDLEGGGTIEKTFAFSLAPREETARENLSRALRTSFDEHLQTRRAIDTRWLSVGLQSLQLASTRGAKNQDDALQSSVENLKSAASTQRENESENVPQLLKETRLSQSGASESPARTCETNHENVTQDFEDAVSTRKAQNENNGASLNENPKSDARHENVTPQVLSVARPRAAEDENDATKSAKEKPKTAASTRDENAAPDFIGGASTRSSQNEEGATPNIAENAKARDENAPPHFSKVASTRQRQNQNEGAMRAENPESAASTRGENAAPVSIDAASTRAAESAKQDAPRAANFDFDAGKIALPEDLLSAYRRCLLCLPLLCGRSGAAVAAPEFDPDFLLCGGYGYCWPRDGAEYSAGLFEAGYKSFVPRFLDWCARHQDERGLWHQRYFLNGAVGPNWCLPPGTLQIDQVGAVLWLAGKYADDETAQNFAPAMRRAADYLLSRLDENGVHRNAFDTWETFVGSFTYSNAAIYAALKAAARVLADEKYAAGAARVKSGVLDNFVRDNGEYSFLVRGLDARGGADETLDSASLGAIEPFELLDLENDSELELARGLLRAVTEKLETEWEGGRAIRRFQNDAYVGGVPACVNTLWMARCCLRVAFRLRETGQQDEARVLAERAQTYLQTVLRRATPTGLLPELMQGPDGARWWAAPHSWAMASFCSGVLQLAKFHAKAPPDVK